MDAHHCDPHTGGLGCQAAGLPGCRVLPGAAGFAGLLPGWVAGSLPGPHEGAGLNCEATRSVGAGGPVAPRGAYILRKTPGKRMLCDIFIWHPKTEM